MGPPAFNASTKTVIADGDTLAGAEAKVLQRAQRNAVEEAGVYFETTGHDVEKESGGRSTQTSSCEIYLRLNQPEQAIEDLSTVIRINPTNAAALVTRAKLYRERLQGRLAKNDLERACVLGSTPACEQLP